MKNITLPSGKKTTIEDGKGFHLLQAQRKAKNTDEIPYALIAELTEFEGQKLPYEDILQFSLIDVSTLLNEMNGTSQEKTSSTPDSQEKTNSQGSIPASPGKSSPQEQSSSSAPQQTQHYQK